MANLLKTKDVAKRYDITEATLKKWRVAGIGPAYIKLGEGRNAEVRYREEDLIKFEEQNRIEVE